MAVVNPKLQGHIEEEGIELYPIKDFLVVLVSITKMVIDYINPRLVKALKKAGITVYTVGMDRNGNVVPHKRKMMGGTQPWVDGDIPKGNRIGEGCEFLTAKDMMAAHILNLFKEKGKGGVIEFLMLSTKQAKQKVGKVVLTDGFMVPISNGRSYTQIIFHFGDDKVGIQTNKFHPVNPMVQFGDNVEEGWLMLALFAFSMLANRKVNQKQVEGWIAGCPSLFQVENNYGAVLQPDDILAIRLSNQVKSIRTTDSSAADTYMNRYPFFALGKAKFTSKALKNLDGSSFPDKYANQFAVLDDGAEASLLSRITIKQAKVTLPHLKVNGLSDDTEILIKPHDGGKVAKDLNRPGQAFGASFADSPLMEETAMTHWTPSGVEAKFRGIPIKAIITNSLLGHGSGAAICHPGWEVSYYIRKTLSGTINACQVPMEVIQHAISIGQTDYLSFVSRELEKKCAGLVGNTFKPGQVILSVFNGRYEIRPIIHTGLNHDLTVTGYKVVRLATSNSITITLEVNLKAHDSNWKARGPGIKCTFVPETVILDQDIDWDVIFPMESLKGRLAQLYMYCNAQVHEHGRAQYKQGVVRFEDGLVVDLSDPNSHFEQWVTNSTKTLLMTRMLSPTIWAYIVQANGGVPNCMTVIEETESAVVIQERVEALCGIYHTQVEISSPRENTGRMSLTPETMANLYMVNKELALAIWNCPESVNHRKGAIQAASMALGPKSDTPVIGVTNEVFKRLLFNADGTRRHGRDLMAAYDREFPDGLVIRSINQSVAELYILPGAFLNFGSFSAGGASTGVALQLVEYLAMLGIYEEYPAGWDSAVHGETARVSGLITTWAGKNLARSNSILRRCTQTAKLVITGKVQTSHQPMVEAVMKDGYRLPKFILHPDCDIVRAGKIKDGDIVAIGRVPMVSLALGVVEVSEYGKVAYVILSPTVWAMANEGDTDGDGIGVLNVSKWVTAEQAFNANNHLLGLRGYLTMYGAIPNQPCAEFFSAKDKWGKKKILGAPPMLNYLRWDDLVNNSEAVANHYSRWVGVSYGWCSALTFMSSELSAQAETNDDMMGIVLIYQKATVIAWRLAYEGLGLGGYTPKSTAFFAAIDAASRGWMVIDSTKDGEISCIPTDVPVAGSITGVEFVVSHFGLDLTVAQLLVEIEMIRSGYRTLERSGTGALMSRSERLGFNPLDSLIYGGLRRAAQGNFNPEDTLDVEGVSVLALAEGLEMYNPILNDMLSITSRLANRLKDVLLVDSDE